MKITPKISIKKTEKFDLIASPWFAPALSACALLLWGLWLFSGANFTREFFESKVNTAESRSTTPPLAQEISATATIQAIELKGTPKPTKATISAQTAAPPTEIKISINQNLPKPQTDEDHMSSLGQAGDAFGGFNALAAVIACTGVFWAGALQRRSLIESREQIIASQAESVFFQMLNLARELQEKVQSTQSNSELSPHCGAAALDAIANHIFENTKQITNNKDLIERSMSLYDQKYKSQPSRLGPYWRILFQIFQLLDESKIKAAQKILLSKIARGQISDGAVLLLALNAMTARGRPFIAYIDAHGLLEHMHPKYLTRYKEALSTTFAPTAFQGSKERCVSIGDVENTNHGTDGA